MYAKRRLNSVILLPILATLCGQAALAADAPPAPKPAPAAPAAKGFDLFGDNLVAKGKDVAVKRTDLDEAMVNLKSSFAAQGQNVTPQQLDLLEQQVLDRLIQIQLLMAKATDVDRTAGKDVTAKRMETIKQRAKTEEDLNRQLKSLGTSQEQLRAKMTEEATAQNVLERELKIKVTEEEAKKFYDENPAKFEQPEMVRVSHMLFATKDLATGQDLNEEKKTAKRKQAEEVLKRARGGEDFAKLVKEFSEDPGSKDSGGEYTFAHASADPQHAMVPEFEAAAFALKTNEISDIVTTQYGLHIIKLLEKIAAKKLELAKVSPDIIEYLKLEQLKARQPDYQAFVEKLKQDAKVVILDEKLKPKDTPPSPGLPAAQPPAKADPKPAAK
jgi:peptidyl-prolyl cis-trans isomerase C